MSCTASSGCCDQIPHILSRPNSQAGKSYAGTKPAPLLNRDTKVTSRLCKSGFPNLIDSWGFEHGSDCQAVPGNWREDWWGHSVRENFF